MTSAAHGTGPRIGVATCADVPDLDDDGPTLLAALREAGGDPRAAVWDDPGTDWAAFDVVLVRSTWDYPLRHAAFLAWAAGCRRTVNPYDVLAWNTDKRYLLDLAAAGVPGVPTVLLPPGSSEPADVGRDVVVKPTVSGSAADAGRFAGLDDPGARGLVARLHGQGRTAMVQPYQPGIEQDGETSLVFLAGAFSHAVRRAPLLTAQGERRAVVVADVVPSTRPVTPSDGQLDLAHRALAAVPGGPERLAYARVDLVPGPDGPVLLELEVTDCFLFLSHARSDAVRSMAERVVGS